MTRSAQTHRQRKPLPEYVAPTDVDYEQANVRTCKPCGRDYRRDDLNGRNLCTPCQRSYSREQGHTWHLKSKYGLTPGEVQAMYAETGPDCPICLEPFEGNRFRCIDHCHESGLVRGVICNFCNRALGIMGDDSERIRRMATYLDATKR